MPAGRPSEYTRDKAELICLRITGGESLRSICRDETMPTKSTVFLWLTRHKEFSDQYARAREAQMEHMAEEILEIADDNQHDIITKENADGSTYEAVNHDHIQRARLRVDTRKWLMARLAPKKYGERTTTEHTGSPDLLEALKVLDGGSRDLPPPPEEGKVKYDA